MNIRLLLFILLTAGIESSSYARSLQFEPSVIYGNDDRLDLYELQDPKLRVLADSTLALFDDVKIVVNYETGVAKIKTSPYGKGHNLCKTERFYDQETGAFCSGFLVGPDLVATAGHCFDEPEDCRATRFVFGFAVTDPGKLPGSVAVSEVYECAELVAQVQEGFSGADYALVRLNRAVQNHKPLKINRSNKITTGTPLVVIGHPTGLPTKVASAASVRKADNANSFIANLDTYQGNSGSAVFDATTGLVDGILVRGETDFVSKNGCMISKRCADNACMGEGVTRISTLAHLIPELAEP